MVPSPSPVEEPEWIEVEVEKTASACALRRLARDRARGDGKRQLLQVGARNRTPLRCTKLLRLQQKGCCFAARRIGAGEGAGASRDLRRQRRRGER